MNKVFLIIIVQAFLFCIKVSAQASCSGSYTTSSSSCQQFTVGNGSPGAIVLCLTTNNIPGGGGTSCAPGGACNPPFSGGGWAPRIAIYTTTGSLVTTWSQTTPAGTCYTLSTINGYAVIYGLCLTPGTVISWNTINQCAASVCTSPPPCAGQPCASCSAACTACGYTSNPSVSTVTTTCPGTTLNIPFGSGQGYTMCATFTAAATTVTFNAIIQSNCTGGNVTNFNWTLQGNNCGAVLQSGNLSNLTFTNLTIGSVYVYCYSFTVPVSPYCQQTIQWPYFVGAYPLPIELVSFKANRNTEGVMLQWKTETEKNSNYFSVERSYNGASFEEIGRVKAAVNSLHDINYEYSDAKSPADKIVYYRLKQVDLDGSYKYSPVEIVNTLLSEGFSLVPNPASNEVAVNFTCNSTSTEFIHVYGRNGQLLLSREVSCEKGMNSVKLNIESFPQGLYYVMMNSQGKSYRSKLAVE
jgi:hypothetical protein